MQKRLYFLSPKSPNKYETNHVDLFRSETEFSVSSLCRLLPTFLIRQAAGPPTNASNLDAD